MFNEEYTKYIKSAKWKAKRELLIAKTGRWCKACRKTSGPLHVHHLDYDRLGAERLSDMVLLCKDCHEKLTKDWRAKGRRSGWSLREFSLYWIARKKSGRGV